LSRFSLLRPVIDTNKCKGCKACSRRCKASCIDTENHSIDYSRCVACMDCLDNCKENAIHYTIGRGKARLAPTTHDAPNGRREFLSIAGLFAVSTLAKAQESHGDGGLAVIEDKKIPQRQLPIVPPGAESLRRFSRHCTACQLCVSVCPNQVLRPTSDLERFMQPEMAYERGYCRPECVKCSEVCPAGAIRKIRTEDKVSTQIGRARWIKENCVVNRDEVPCTACERHCPTGAIQLMAIDPDDRRSLKIPVVDTELCNGCGACEYYCPARPFSAMVVDGNDRHRMV
jgi:ferredoxin